MDQTQATAKGFANTLSGRKIGVIAIIGALSAQIAISIWPSAHAGEEPKPANAEAGTSAEAKAKADYDAAGRQPKRRTLRSPP